MHQHPGHGPLPVRDEVRSQVGVGGQDPRGLHDGPQARVQDEERLDSFRQKTVRYATGVNGVGSEHIGMLVASFKEDLGSNLGLSN